MQTVHPKPNPLAGQMILYLTQFVCNRLSFHFVNFYFVICECHPRNLRRLRRWGRVLSLQDSRIGNKSRRYDIVARSAREHYFLVEQMTIDIKNARQEQISGIEKTEYLPWGKYWTKHAKHRLQIAWAVIRIKFTYVKCNRYANRNKA